MNSWFNLLTESSNKNDLSNYVTIYHIKSCSYDENLVNKNISLNDIITIVKEKSLDIHNDTLEIFVATKEDSINDLIVIFNPYELFQNPYVYKIIYGISEGVKNMFIINSEQIK